ncbi:hypothetical protein HanXRQr2_Chr01g0018491 [Helianthus annuus]|uniref:Uncharacterized protein n=1 Tax=Helianthus annuus TaxID=4232 RepID=A0A251VMQ7_HELAN|nr:hypothetical protein HanXRQr2_Chr01g0018491 [Helianthus annuus]KAJ0622405.1 hypothetical protein HanIR_Chr01g0020181 [Helianthus annuus]KAJ0956659.1 hypothetical protein HanPSC8_Chr01g0017991 [Helianthus annuus]
MDSASNDELGLLSHSMDEVNGVQISMLSFNFDHDRPFCVNSFEQQDSISSHVYELPSGSSCWIPVVPLEIMSLTGARFRSLQEACWG